MDSCVCHRIAVAFSYYDRRRLLVEREKSPDSMTPISWTIVVAVWAIPGILLAIRARQRRRRALWKFEDAKFSAEMVSRFRKEQTR